MRRLLVRRECLATRTRANEQSRTKMSVRYWMRQITHIRLTSIAVVQGVNEVDKGLFLRSRDDPPVIILGRRCNDNAITRVGFEGHVKII
jgi:hypothetical protein